MSSIPQVVNTEGQSVTQTPETTAPTQRWHISPPPGAVAALSPALVTLLLGQEVGASARALLEYHRGGRINPRFSFFTEEADKAFRAVEAVTVARAFYNAPKRLRDFIFESVQEPGYSWSEEDNPASIEESVPAFIEWWNRFQATPFPFLVEAQFGGENPECVIVDRATTRAKAERAAEELRKTAAADPDFLGCFVREVTEGGNEDGN